MAKLLDIPDDEIGVKEHSLNIGTKTRSLDI